MKFLEWLVPSSLEPIQIPTTATFPIDSELQYRQRVARASLPVDNMKRLIEPEPESELPIG